MLFPQCLRCLAWFCCALAMLLPWPALAQKAQCGPQQTTLIELYTSQGCSSCPPAERWLNSYKDSPQLWRHVVPVAFHVDYWNYLGWADTFANERYSSRQRQHARLGNIGSVYTPGTLVNGKEWRGQFAGKPLPPRARTRPGTLKLHLTDSGLLVRFTAQNGARAQQVNIAWLGNGIVTKIKRGENAGLDLPQEFVVLEHSKIPFDAAQQTSLPLPVDITYQSLAVWLTDARERAVQACGMSILDS